MLLALLGLIARDRRLRRFRLLGRLWRPDWPRFREVFRVGLPIAGQMWLEIGLFAGAALVVGLLGAVPVAAHAVAVQVAAATFMVPLGIGQAATARVGLAAGAGDAAGAALAGSVAVALGTGFMAVDGAGHGGGLGRPALAVPRRRRPSGARGGGQRGDPAGDRRAVPVGRRRAGGRGGRAARACATRGCRCSSPRWATGRSACRSGSLLGFPFGLGASGIWIGLARGLAVGGGADAAAVAAFGGGGA